MMNMKIVQVVMKIEILIRWKRKSQKNSKLPKEKKLKQSLYHFNFTTFNYYY